ncbi:MAG: PEP-CTERM sorting domain-containing protein, partial [bacterium]
PCATSITINGTLIGGGNNVLANNNVDPGGNFHNEAANYAAYGATTAFSVSTGYADNVHADPCADADGNCHPDPFAASGTDTFIGGGTNGAGLGIPQGGANHCSTTVASNDCFDAGVVRIVALNVPRVPEPSTLLLLGAGIMGLAAWGRSRRRA